MHLLIWILLFSLLGGVLSVLVASAFLLFGEKRRAQLLPHLVSFAIGALLGVTFLEILPHALETPGADAHTLSLTILFGLIGFFLLEKMVLWRHSHSDPYQAHAPGQGETPTQAAGALILIGDGIHNFIDGVLIGAAFLADIRVGVVTSLAVAAHEIPQEVGDFAILLHSGYGRGKALFYNVLSSLTTVIGGLLAYYSLAGTKKALPFVLALAASSFIYIAMADLIPGLHKRAQLGATARQIVLISAGIALIYVGHVVLH